MEIRFAAHRRRPHRAGGVYTAWAHLAALVTAGAFAALLWSRCDEVRRDTWTPPGRRSVRPGRAAFTGQRPWALGIALVAVLAALLAQPPALLAVMALAGASAVACERFNPDALRWRVAGGQAR